MAQRSRRRIAVVLLLGACTATAGYAAFSRSEDAAPVAGGVSNGTGTVVGGNRTASPSPAPYGPAAVAGRFSISGRVAGLVPGRPASLPLTVTNPNPWPINVLSLDVTVTPVPACPAGTLRVTPFTGAVRTPALGRVVIAVPVELVDSTTTDQSGCPGTTFPLSFSGTAERLPS